MSVLNIRRKLAMFLTIIFMATIGHAKMGAVIITGEEFDNDGLEIEQALIGKNYDVHVAQVHSETKLFEISDWSETPLVKSLDKEGPYDKMLFIVDGHGHENIGAQIYWNSLLKLVKNFEEKSSEIFIYLNTCFSGDAADQWLPEIGEKVKVFITSSCKGHVSLSRNISSLSIQIFTGFYLNMPKELSDTNNVTVEKYKNLKCDSTIDDLADAFYQPCGRHNGKHGQHKVCTKVHVHRGGDVKLQNWNILPRNLSEIKSATRLEEFEDIPFADESCKLNLQPFITKEFSFYPTINITQNLDLPSMTIIKKRIFKEKDGQKHELLIPTQLEHKGIQNFSTILNADGDVCDLEKNCDRKKIGEKLKAVSKLELGYYKTRDIWILDNDSPYAVDPHPNPNHPGEEPEKKDYTMTIIIVVCTLVGLAIIIGLISYFFCCNKGARKRQRLYNGQIQESEDTNPQQNQITIDSNGNQNPPIYDDELLI